MRPRHMLAMFATMIAVMFLIGPCQTMQRGEHSLAVGESDGRGIQPHVNAFALGFFSGLTIGTSDYALGSLMTGLESNEPARTAARMTTWTRSESFAASAFCSLVDGACTAAFDAKTSSQRDMHHREDLGRT